MGTWPSCRPCGLSPASHAQWWDPARSRAGCTADAPGPLVQGPAGAGRPGSQPQGQSQRTGTIGTKCRHSFSKMMLRMYHLPALNERGLEKPGLGVLTCRPFAQALRSLPRSPRPRKGPLRASSLARKGGDCHSEDRLSTPRCGCRGAPRPPCRPGRLRGDESRGLCPEAATGLLRETLLRERAGQVEKGGRRLSLPPCQPPSAPFQIGFLSSLSS